MSHNLFFALWPDDTVRARIEAAALQLERSHCSQGRLIDARRYHLTLQFLGAHADVPPALLAALHGAGDAVPCAPFDLVLDTAGSFANRKVTWWLGCRAPPKGLVDLWDGLAAGLGANGFAADAPSRRAAHVTIVRDADRALSAPIDPIAWPVSDFVLVDSLPGAQPGYTILRRWRLGG